MQNGLIKYLDILYLLVHKILNCWVDIFLVSSRYIAIIQIIVKNNNNNNNNFIKYKL